MHTASHNLMHVTGNFGWYKRDDQLFYFCMDKVSPRFDYSCVQLC
jgi:hypothetical protein